MQAPVQSSPLATKLKPGRQVRQRPPRQVEQSPAQAEPSAAQLGGSWLGTVILTSASQPPLLLLVHIA